MRANLTDTRLAVPVPVQKGYMFQYTPGANGANTGFCMGGSTGTAKFNREGIFLLDEEGVLRQADSQIVGSHRDAMDAPESEADQEKDEN